MQEKQTAIHEKGFNIMEDRTLSSYNKIKTNSKVLEDAVLNLSGLRQVDKIYTNKACILKALCQNDLPTIREISKFFYRTNGIYARACNYIAQMYRYDWYITPEVFDESVKEDKILTDFSKLLNYLDNSHIKKVCSDIALEVVKMGAYYGYIVPSEDGVILQQLPINYCRSRFSIGDVPVVEFNMKFFDDYFADITYRMKILKLFPQDFQKGYVLYKQGKLLPEYSGDVSSSWYTLDSEACVKFNIYNDDLPIFINAIPALLDLDAAQELDRRKQMQQLLKILIQKLPLDKNGDLIFDVEEARDIHSNAVEMLQNAVGVDVLTTFADIEVVDLADKKTTASQDDLAKVERTVFNAMGLTKNNFNSDGNIATEKSILNDESMARTLLYQFNIFYDKIVRAKGKNKKKYNFRLYMLETTQNNYKELAKMYKEQVQIGYSKMLPQIAMGHSQSSIIHTAYFENEVLHLSEIMIPPLMSSTLNGQDILGAKSQSNGSKNQNNTAGSSSENSVGRPAKDESQQSDKTLANKESMG